ncbi:MAG: succinate dehydrogenase, cytochrome b556 subunit [Chloroflexota bacterium]|jgi:succinate dehydrogenase / fumarate reductase cytochrome b subunit
MQQAQESLNDVRPKRPLSAWFDVRGHKTGSWAFALNRLTGLGLALYLFIHLVVLSTLLRGEAAWDDFVKMAKTPAFLLLDVVLIVGLVFHGLNGVRVALVGTGIAAEKQRSLFWILMTIGIVVTIAAAVLVFVAEG